jgi:hypothetical protein
MVAFSKSSSSNSWVEKRRPVMADGKSVFDEKETNLVDWNCDNVGGFASCREGFGITWVHFIVNLWLFESCIVDSPK